MTCIWHCSKDWNKLGYTIPCTLGAVVISIYQCLWRIQSSFGLFHNGIVSVLLNFCPDHSLDHVSYLDIELFWLCFIGPFSNERESICGKELWTLILSQYKSLILLDVLHFSGSIGELGLLLNNPESHFISSFLYPQPPGDKSTMSQ